LQPRGPIPSKDIINMTNIDDISSGDKPPTESTNPFENLDALRCPQDYSAYLGAEPITQYQVRTLREAMHLRVNPDTAYHFESVYVVDRGRSGKFFVYPQFKDALGPLPRRCNLYLAIDGHGTQFLLQVKQANPDQDENIWYESARTVAAAAMRQWVKVSKPAGEDKGWGYIPIQHKMFEPAWTKKPMKDVLASAFADRVVDSIGHDLIREFEERGA
jgi:hypothetical protein